MNAKENMLRVINRNKPGWVPNGGEGIVTLFPPIIERPSEPGQDVFGVRWDLEEGAEGGTYPAINGHTITDLHQWQSQIQIPDVNAFDWSVVANAAAKIDRDEYLVQGFVEMGLFERSYLLLGMEEALVSYLTEPDLMKELLAAIADYKIDFIRRFHEVATLDMIWYGDDWGTQSNLFLPVSVWRDVIKPGTKRIYDCMNELGIIVNQHSCGKIEAIVEDLVDMGADIWNPCQPCNDLAGLKKKYGHALCFCGGIDSQFVLGKPGVTAGEVRAEVRKRIDEMASGGGYIAAPSHDVPYDKDLLRAMNDEIWEYGGSFYTGATQIS